MATSHRAGKWKQKNKKHKTGKHRSKGEIETRNKGKVPTAIKRSKKLIFDKTSRRMQKQHLKQMKEGRLQNVKSMMGEGTCPTFVTFVSFDNSISVEQILTQIQSCCPNSQITSHPMKSFIRILHLNDSNKVFYLNFIPNQTFSSVVDSFEISDYVIICSSSSTQLNISNQLDSIIEIIKHESMSKILHLCLLSSHNDHTNKKYLLAYHAIMSPHENQLSLNHFQRNTPHSEFRIFNEIVPILNILMEGPKRPSITKIYSNIKTPTLHLHPYLIVDKMEINPIETHDPSLVHCSIYGVLCGNHINSTNKYINFLGQGDFPLESIRVVQSSLYKNIVGETQTNPMDMDSCFTFEHPPENIEDSIIDESCSIAPNNEELEFDDQEESSDENDSQLSNEFSGDFSDGSYEDGDSILNTPSYVYYQDHSMMDAPPNIRYIDGVAVPHVPLKELLKGYRGMASFKNSYWDPQSDVPFEYSKICKFTNFDASKRRSLNDDVCIAKSGNYICLTIRNMPKQIFDSIVNAPSNVIIGHFLYDYEHKISLNHFIVQRTSSFNKPITTGMKLIVQSDFRFYHTNSYLISEFTLQCDKWRSVDSFDKNGKFALSLFSPITYPPNKIRIFLVDDESNKITLIATGSGLRPNPDRIILTQYDIVGHIHKNFKRYVVIKGMFDNMGTYFVAFNIRDKLDDVNYFKSVGMTTKSGRLGHIIESVGTHGSMKCKFNGTITQQDKVQMSLYKRVFPKWDFELQMGYI